ncbi:MAG TPA: hypothetical protein VHC39_07455 [Rhizomicrobium sp.]|nr:hypothetical protein [Rhizomicrobium sp.]
MELKTANELKFPWQPHSFITGNLAIGNLGHKLRARLTVQGRIHAETLLVGIGAIAGFASQNAALIRGAEATRQAGAVPPNSVVLATTREGSRILLGDWINGYIAPQKESQFSLHNFAGAAAISAGVKAQDLPDFREMFQHVVKAAGTSAFGKVRAPACHDPQFQPVNFLKLGGWGLMVGIMALKPPVGVTEPPLEEAHWPIIASIVAGRLINQAKDVLAPGIAYAMVMEAAIIASKAFPDTIETGKWALDARAGKLAVHRL